MPLRGYSTKLEVFENRPVRDGAGQLVPKWARVGRRFFKLTPVSGNESRRGESVESTATHTAECRYFAGAKPQQQLRREGRTFEVVGVVDRGNRHRFLDWQLAEVVG